MWYCPVKFGGDSGAVREVSDIGPGFRSASFTVRSRGCHGIHVKRQIITAGLSRELVLGQGNGPLFHASSRSANQRACAARRRCPTLADFARVTPRLARLASCV